MLIKALCSFSGTISMVPGEVRNVTEETGHDLIRAGFAVSEEEKTEPVAPEPVAPEPVAPEPVAPEPVEEKPTKKPSRKKSAAKEA
ncbi:hypothetical protein [Acidaminococcus intestini]|uniref:hypothetical protein n=1 Tax=Acidaminococcus intestini TaxID=187327 RepID=UPI002671BCC6|nr:hypothetical protein [Acidaminococcus intestini]